MILMGQVPLTSLPVFYIRDQLARGSEDSECEIGLGIQEAGTDRAMRALQDLITHLPVVVLT